MCLVTFIKDAHPKYPFIMVGNRDELYDRPAAPLHRWLDHPEVVAGVDLVEKGTWLGYIQDGRFITVLNYPFVEWEPTLETPRSRGQLLRDYLTEDIPLAEFEAYLQEHRRDYNGYHLLYGTFNDLKYYSNVTDRFHTFDSGIFCLSNTFDDLSAHRVERSKEHLAAYVDEAGDDLKVAELIPLLQDKLPTDTLEDYPEELSYEMALNGSSVFIQGEEFGTVGTTAILVDNNGNISVQEVKYSRTGVTEITTKEHQINITF